MSYRPIPTEFTHALDDLLESVLERCENDNISIGASARVRIETAINGQEFT